MDKKRSQTPQYAATLIVDLISFTYGLAVGWTAIAVPVLQSEHTHIDTGPISDQDASWLASTLCIVAVPFTPLYRYFCERFGRKVTGYLTIMPYIISTLLVIFGKSLISLHASRVFLGIGTGGTFIYCPMYVSEIAEDNIRGALGVLLGLMLNCGIFMAYVIGTFFSFHTAAWICLIPPVAFMLLAFWLPETPVYLLRQNKRMEAAKSLRKLRGKDSDITEELEQMEISLKAMDSESSKSASYLDLFSSRGKVRAVFLSLMLFFNQQFCGIFGIINYTVAIFQESGSTLSPNMSSIIVGFMLIVATILTWYLCDRVGRKALLLTSDILMAVSLATLGVYFYLKQQGQDVQSFGWVPVTCLSIYVIAINIGLGPIPIIIVTELFSPKFRGMAISLLQPISWILSFLVGKFYSDLCYLMGIHGCYWFFSACCILGTIGIIFLIPETKNRPLESIIEELESNNFFKTPFRKSKSTYNSYSTSKL